MPVSSSELVRDTTSVLRFLRSIYGRRDEIDRTHRRATVEFLGYISTLGQKTETYLQKLVARPSHPELAASDRQNLLTLRDFWNDLHGFVQPSRDADTLHIPNVLIDQLEDRLSAVPALAGTRVVISHTTELNYIQYPRSGLRERAEYYAAIVPGSPKFPRKLALIAMPYSQEASIFSNLMICHEMGHFAFEELHLLEKLSPYFERSLRKHLKNLSEPDYAWCRERLISWAEEIFCDRFAIGLVGPAFSFAYIELFDVRGVADNNDQINEFSDTHPSDACRFRAHFEQLDQAGWWPLLDSSGSSYAELIRRLHHTSVAKYDFSSDQKPRLARRVLAAFKEIEPKVGALVKRTFGGHECRFRGEIDCVNAIQSYLSWGVVPATLVREKTVFRPDPILLLNSAYLFLLENLGSLMERIGGQNVTDLIQRERWCQRVEQWTMKALEDLRLPTGRKAWEY